MPDLGFVLLLTVWAAGVGLRVARRCGPASGHPADDLALAVPLGLGILALATLGLAELGVLSLPGLGIVFVGGIVLGRLRHDRGRGSSPRPRIVSDSLPQCGG